MQDTKRQNTKLSNNNHIIVGASGSGKSAFIRKNIDFKQNRIIAWDPDEDFRLPRVRSISVFANTIKLSFALDTATLSMFGLLSLSKNIEPESPLP